MTVCIYLATVFTQNVPAVLRANTGLVGRTVWDESDSSAIIVWHVVQLQTVHFINDFATQLIEKSYAPACNLCDLTSLQVEDTKDGSCKRTEVIAQSCDR